MSAIKYFAIFVAGWSLCWKCRSASQRQTGWQWYLAREQMVARDVVAAGVTASAGDHGDASDAAARVRAGGARQLAYFDMALPIGEQQTISPPFVVATMTAQLDPQPDDKVLEIGTGSGYQAAVLAGVVSEVYTIEIHEPLARTADADADAARLQERAHQARRRFSGLARACPVRQDHRHLFARKSPPAAGRSIARRGPNGHSARRALSAGALSDSRKQDGKLVAQAIEPTFFVPMTGTAEQQRDILPDGSRPSLVNGGVRGSGRNRGHSERLVLCASGHARGTRSRWPWQTDDLVSQSGARPLRAGVASGRGGWTRGSNARRLGLGSRPKFGARTGRPRASPSEHHLFR